MHPFLGRLLGIALASLGALPAALPTGCGHAPPHARAVEQVRRGYAHLAAGDRERAEVAFEHALEMAPDLPEARAGLAVALRVDGRPAEAVRHLDAALAADPELAEAHADRGEALLALGREEDAMAALAEALALDPDQVAARLVRARTLAARARAAPAAAARAALLARARRDLLHALEARPSLALAHADLGWVHWLEGDLPAAARAYGEAVRLDPSLAGAQLGACAALAAAGDPGARPACARCAAAVPSPGEEGDRCRTWLARLEP